MRTSRTKAPPTDWTTSAAATAKYLEARAEAQKKADETGFDYGLERNDLFKSFHTFMLPAKRFRCGHELRCEVISCMTFSKIQPGHGPGAA